MTLSCNKHCTDLSSIVGVCASCLREHLFYLVAAQEQAQAQTQTLDETNCNSETHPVIPPSVSPYISRRETDNSASSTNNQHSNRRSFSTPQVAPTTGSYNSCRKKKQSFIRFSLLSSLFRSTKRNADSNYIRGSCGGDDNATSAMSSSFWFFNKRSGAGNRKNQPFCFSEASIAPGAGVTQKQHCRDRGMSPVRYSDCDGAEDEICNGSSGYDTCESRKRTPAHPAVRRGGGRTRGHGKNATSGLKSFCLSPLVRPSPWNQKGVVPVDCGVIRAPVKPHLSNTKSFCANRSRKVADFGRIATNRGFR